jgi:DNA-directed RNA polymerase subunit RPC12/RpoP
MEVKVMNVMDIGFMQGEESWLSPKEETTEYICDKCEQEIGRGEPIFEIFDGSDKEFCERCALDWLYDHSKFA